MGLFPMVWNTLHFLGWVEVRCPLTLPVTWVEVPLRSSQRHQYFPPEQAGRRTCNCLVRPSAIKISMNHQQLQISCSWTETSEDSSILSHFTQLLKIADFESLKFLTSKSRMSRTMTLFGWFIMVQEQVKLFGYDGILPKNGLFMSPFLSSSTPPHSTSANVKIVQKLWCASHWKENASASWKFLRQKKGDIYDEDIYKSGRFGAGFQENQSLTTECFVLLVLAIWPRLWFTVVFSIDTFAIETPVKEDVCTHTFSLPSSKFSWTLLFFFGLHWRHGRHLSNTSSWLTDISTQDIHNILRPLRSQDSLESRHRPSKRCEHSHSETAVLRMADGTK